MPPSRRAFASLLPVLAAAQPRPAGTLPAAVYAHDAIPYQPDPDNPRKKGRRFFRGAEHSGFGLEAHETILGPGSETHEPHKHEHEEILVVFEGTVQTYMEGKTELAVAGSVIYFGSNQMHSLRNAGPTPCRYYVIELRGKQA